MLTGDTLRRSANRFPDKCAVLWDDRALSYRVLDQQADQFARGLLTRKLGSGTHIGILCRNRSEYVTAFFGAARSGAVLVNVSVLYSADELAYVLEKADVQALIFETEFEDKVRAVMQQLPKLKHLVVIGRPNHEGDSFEQFINGHSVEPHSLDIDENSPFCMTYTGGTTGRPKGVLADHRSRLVTAHTVVVESGLNENDVVAIVTPLFHVAALNITLQPSVLVGATIVLQTKWDVREFARLTREYNITAAFMVPTQLSMVVNDPEFHAEDYTSWRRLNFSGAPMPDWVLRLTIEKLPELNLTQFYGQSEMGIVAAMKHTDLPKKLGAVGRQVYNADVSLVDTDGCAVAVGEVGEIVSRGDNVMREYYNEPEQTQEFFRLGWAWSGDLARFDEDGYLTLVDRSKDMIISGGENIYPKEIEDVLYQHDAVAECAVFGIPDDKWGEVPIAYVVSKNGAVVTDVELIDHCTTLLARFKRPRHVKLVNDFPKTPIGKIQKNVLRQPYWSKNSNNTSNKA